MGGRGLRRQHDKARIEPQVARPPCKLLMRPGAGEDRRFAPRRLPSPAVGCRVLARTPKRQVVAREPDAQMIEQGPHDDDDLWRDVEQHELRAVKRLDADADNAPLSDGYHMALPPPGVEPFADLTRAMARDLVAAGFTIHDCAGKAPGGGVCLTPASNAEGVIVTWTQHDAAEAALGWSRASALQEQMNFALADVLATMGYPVKDFGQATAHIVTGPRPRDESDTTASA